MGEIRRIQMPEPLALVVNGKPWGIEDTIQHLLENEPKFNEDGPGIRSSVRVEAAKNAGVVAPGREIVLRDEDWQRLHAAFEKPSAGYMPQLSMVVPVDPQNPDGETRREVLPVPGRSFLGFIDAVANAATGEAK